MLKRVLAAGCRISVRMPGPLYQILPFPVDYDTYTLTTLVKGFQILLFTGLAYALLLNVLTPKDRIQLDLDWLYRRPARSAFYVGPAALAHAFGTVERAVYGVVFALVRVGRDPVGWLRGVGKPVGPDHPVAVSDSAAFRVTMTAMVAVLLLTLGALSLLVIF